MQLAEYQQYDALGLAKLVRDKEVSSLELVACAKEAIQQCNPRINAVIEVFEKCIVASEQSSSSNSVFSGVPFLIKDIVLQVEGVRNEMGSRLTEGVIASHDTDLMQRFKRAGLATIGRTSTPEFGLNVATESILTGPTCNPWDTSKMAGGSSGGAAAAVAAGIVPMAHANDGGGSIRGPAACCGLIGLKPTRGRIPVGPDVGEVLFGLGAEFAVTRSVRDTAALLDAVQGPGVGDRYIASTPDRSFEDQIQLQAKPLKIAFTCQSWSGSPVDGEVKEALLITAKQCEALGHTLVEASPSFDYPYFFAATVRHWSASLAAWVEELGRTYGRPLDDSTMEATSLAAYEYGKTVSASELIGAFGVANTVSRKVGNFFQEYDVLLTPTIARPAQPIGTFNANDPSLSIHDWMEKLFSFTPFVALFNMTGQPAISLPLQRTRTGLPLGMQFVGRFADESTLLSLAAQLEEAISWPKTAVLDND